MGWAALPAAISGVSSIGSGIKGKNAANEANQRQAQLDQTNQNFMNTGMGMMEGMQNQANNFLSGGGMAGDLMNQAQTGGAQFANQMQGLAGQLTGGAPSFDFATGQNTMDQTMSTFQNFANNQRNAAFDQAASGFTAQSGALDAALASRGMSRNSGVGAAALGNIAAEGGAAMAGLNRDLSNQAGQIGLDAAKFDVTRGLQEQDMASRFALGSAAQQAQNLGMAGDMYGQAYQNPLAMQQQMYQQNQVNPFLAMTGMSNPMDLLSMAFGGMSNATATAGANAAQGGAGMGAGLAGMTGQMWDFLSNKNSTPTGG